MAYQPAANDTLEIESTLYSVSDHPAAPGMPYGQVLLEKDISETDTFGRTLRYVWLKHPDGQRMLNVELVKWGYAQVSTYPPDVKYQQLFLDAQAEAVSQNRGLWASCGSFGIAELTSTPLPVAAATSTPVRVAKPSLTNPPAQPKPPSTGGLRYDPFGPDRDCPDFPTHAEAQRFFIAAGGPNSDPHRVDGDNDGIACESNR